MKQKFYSDAAKSHFYWCLIALAVLVGMHLLTCLTLDNDLPRRPDTIQLNKSYTLTYKFNEKEVNVTLPKGTEVKVLGARRGSMTFPERLWVELEDGTRTLISCEYFDVEYEAIPDGEKTPKPCEVQGKDGDRLNIQFKDGTTDEQYCGDVYPIWPKSLKFKYLSNSSISSSYMSLSKFEEKFIGSTFEKNDKRQFPATSVYHKGGLTEASYDLWVLDTSTGLRYKPVVVYNSDGIAESYRLGSPEKRAKIFLKYMPFVGKIVDVPCFNILIKGSFYDVVGESRREAGLVGKIIGFAVALIMGIFLLLWFYATPMVPVLLMGVLMHNPKIFYPLNNKVLGGLISVVAIVSTYIWAALLVGWGIMWLFLLPIIFASIFVTTFVSSPLIPDAPCARCLKCRNIESMNFVDSVYDHEYEKWMRETEYVKKISEKERKYKTWNQVTWRRGDGSTYTTNENVQNHTQIITTSLYDDYKVLYNVKVYQNNYSCVVCGQHEHNFSEKYTEIDRKYMGTHTETTTEEV